MSQGVPPPGGVGGTSSTASFHNAQRMALIRAQQSMAAQQQPHLVPQQAAFARQPTAVRPMAAQVRAASVPARAAMLTAGARVPGVAATRAQGGVTAAATGSTATQMGRNIVINQPGLRPGVPGSQITVPLTTLQGLQPGQGIPTGQAGHLLVKTETGQYQILRVGQSAAATAPTGVAPAVAGIRPQQSIRAPLPAGLAPQQQPITSVAVAATPVSVAAAARSRAASATSSVSTASAASGGGGAGGVGGSQMSSDTAKLKCKNFLATLLRLARDQDCPNVANNVRNLIQGLIDGTVEPEDFTSKLQQELSSSPQPCLVPFLKRSLPFLQEALRSGELTLEGVQAPKLAVPQPAMAAPVRMRGVRPTQQSLINQRQQQQAAALAAQQMRAQLPNVPMRPQQQMRPTVQQQSPLQLPPQRFAGAVPVTAVTGAVGVPPFNTATSAAAARLASLQPGIPPSAVSAGSLPGATLPIKPSPISTGLTPSTSMPAMVAATTLQQQQSLMPAPVAGAASSSLAAVVAAAAAKEKAAAAKANTFSTAGDEDINDVAAMGGVNLAEESQRMQQALVGTQVRSCKDEVFLQTGNLTSRIAKLCSDRGLDEPGPEVMALMSHATQDRLKTLLEKLSVIAEHRMDVIRLEGDAYEVTQDVKGQVRFLSDLDRLEKTRHEQAERQRLLMAARSRTKTDDPEKEKLKEKAKELQRLEEEQMLQEKANTTALLAIGGPKKKARMDDMAAMMMRPGGSGASSSSMGGPMAQAAPTSIAQAQMMRPKTKRVHQRDLMFLMEQEKDLKRSATLWKAYIS